jgi:hypothetical protein
MEQSFLLKHYGHVDLEEQRTMTAEERNWWLTRIDTEHRREKEASKGYTTGKAPQTPGRPPA